MAGVSRGIGGVTALPTRKYWPPRSKRFMEDTASWDDWAFSYSAEQERSEGQPWGWGVGEGASPHPHLPKLTNEAIALVLASRGVPSQRAGFDLAKGLKHTLDVIIREVLVHGSHVDAVEGSRLLGQLVYDGLSLPYVAGSAHLG